jgi:hypothetical protein
MVLLLKIHYIFHHSLQECLFRAATNANSSCNLGINQKNVFVGSQNLPIGLKDLSWPDAKFVAKIGPNDQYDQLSPKSYYLCLLV